MDVFVVAVTRLPLPVPEALVRDLLGNQLRFLVGSAGGAVGGVVGEAVGGEFGGEVDEAVGKAVGRGVDEAVRRAGGVVGGVNSRVLLRLRDSERLLLL